MTAPLPAAPLPALVARNEFALWPGVIVGDDETESADYVLLAASNFIRVESGDPDRWADPSAAPASIRTVVVQVAARIWRNPDGVTMRTDGPFSEQFTQTVEAGLTLTDTERRIVEKTTARSPLWTVSVQRDADIYPDPYYDIFSGETIPPSPYPPDTWLYGLPS